jgi:hypothetical protein
VKLIYEGGPLGEREVAEQGSREDNDRLGARQFSGQAGGIGGRVAGEDGRGIGRTEFHGAAQRGEIPGGLTASQLTGDRHRRGAIRGGCLTADPVAVAVEKEVQPGAGTHLDEGQRTWPALAHVVEAESEGDAAADLVGLRRPGTQEPGKLIPVLAAERGEGRRKLIVDRPPAAVHRIVRG